MQIEDIKNMTPEELERANQELSREFAKLMLRTFLIRLGVALTIHLAVKYLTRDRKN
jgi:hypothetical protein